MAIRKYSDQQHHLVRALCLINKAAPQPVLTDGEILNMVGPLRDGSFVPQSTMAMCYKAAQRAIDGKITFAKFFERTSETKRSQKGT